MQNSILDTSWYAWTYREDGLNRLSDGNMAKPTAASWSSFQSTPSKLVGQGMFGTNALRTTYVAGGSWFSYQNITSFPINSYVRVRVYLRSDGVNAPVLWADTGLAARATGTLSTNWQYFDVTVQLIANQYIAFGGIGGAGGYVDACLASAEQVTAQAYNQSKGPLILPANLVADASMLAENTQAWFANNAAVLSKQPGFSGGQAGRGQCLRVARGAGNNPWAQQRSKFTAGVPIVLDAWARSDGTKVPQIIDGTATGMWTGTTSTSPQRAFTAATPANTSFGLYQADTVGGYTEWQDTNAFNLSDYLLGPVTFVGCTSAGAIEGKTIIRVAKAIGGDEIDISVWNASPGASAVIPLTSPWLYACNSGSRTTQTSASTIVLNIGAHQAPWRNVDGIATGLSLEPRRTNLIAYPISAWALTNVTRAAVTDPSGTLTASRITDSDVVNLGFASLSMSGVNNPLPYTLSMWNADTGDGNATSSSINSNNGAVNFTVAWPVTTWNRRSVSGVTTVAASTASVVPAANAAAATGAISVYGPQFEIGSYPTSVILTVNAPVTRAEAYLLIQRDVLNLSGEHYPVIEFAPHYASTEAGLDDVILDDPQVGRVFYRAVDRKFVARLYGYRGECVSDACTFSRNQVLRLQVSPNLAAGTLTLDILGCTGGAGDGSYFTRIETVGQRYLQQGDGVTTTTFPTVVPEHGISFDGGDHCVTGIVDPFEWNTPFTLMAIVDLSRCTPDAFQRPIVSSWGAIANFQGFTWNIVDTGNMLFYLCNHLTAPRYAGITAPLTTWREPVVVAAVSEGTGTVAGMRLYANGNPLVATTLSDTLAGNTIRNGASVLIGARWNVAAIAAQMPAKSRIYQVKMIPKALGPSDIKSLSSIMMGMLQV